MMQITDGEKVAPEIELLMNYNIFKSKTFWTLVVMFLVNGYASISGQMSPDVNLVANVILTGLASYFHLQTGQSVTGTN